MSVSARTFQILYVIRRLLLIDQGTSQANISEFIAERRKSAPHLYDRAYISPSALSEALDRMTTTEGLLQYDTSNSNYSFTPTGSHMADLIDQLDACSNNFLDYYKERVCLAVLEMRSRLGLPPASPRDVAACAYISLDSARRGLERLHLNGEAILRQVGRSSTYTLPDSASTKMVEPDVEDVPQPEVEETVKLDPIMEILADLDETEWAPEPKEEEEDEPFQHFLKGILNEEDKEPPPVFTKSSVASDEPEARPESNEWASVPQELQQAFIHRAKACGMGLTLFLETVNHVQKGKIREALLKH